VDKIIIKKINEEISLTLSVEDFKKYFSLKQERTASSPSGRHMGHYKVIIECICRENFLLPDLILAIAQTSLATASPLARWHHASQVMLEKGKGSFVENLRIIQLCEADLNFVLHKIWGHGLTRHALSHNALDKAQFALPGQTCNNAVLNKVLFLDLSRQLFSPGILVDYDASAAFDWVLANLSMVTCQRVGLPRIAGYFMTYLLKHMTFHLITGFGKSAKCYTTTVDEVTGQGVLQGSSSAAPLYIFNSDIPTNI
jgi:hypothetical protein